MVNLNRQIAVARARQGGFSAHVLPGAVSYQPAAPGGWGMGWLLVDYQVDDSNFSDVVEMTAYSGTGNAKASLSVNTGATSESPRGYRLLPVYGDVFVLAIDWGIQTASGGDLNGDLTAVWARNDFAVTWGIGKQGFLVSRTSVSVISISESLADWAAEKGALRTGGGYGTWPFKQWDDTQSQSDIIQPLEAASYAKFNSSPTENNHNRVSCVWNTGIDYGETATQGPWRLSLTSDFGDAVDQVAGVITADEGSVWAAPYQSGGTFALDIKEDETWSQWSDPVIMDGSRQSMAFTQWVADYDFLIFGGQFFPLISIPLSDRRAWFQTEHGMTIT